MKYSGPRKSSILTAAAVLIPFFASLAAANAADMLEEESPAYTEVEFGTGWYIRGDVGSSFSSTATTVSALATDDSAGTAQSFGLGAGYNFNSQFRGELQYSYAMGFVEPSTNLDVSISTAMANVYLDGPTFWNITPYVGVGGGLALVTDGATFQETPIAPSWNAMVGAGYKINKNLTFDLGYRYLSTQSATVASGTNAVLLGGERSVSGLDIHEVRVGLRYEIW